MECRDDFLGVCRSPDSIWGMILAWRSRVFQPFPTELGRRIAANDCQSLQGIIHRSALGSIVGTIAKGRNRPKIHIYIRDPMTRFCVQGLQAHSSFFTIRRAQWVHSSHSSPSSRSSCRRWSRQSAQPHSANLRASVPRAPYRPLRPPSVLLAVRRQLR